MMFKFPGFLLVAIFILFSCKEKHSVEKEIPRKTIATENKSSAPKKMESVESTASYSSKYLAAENVRLNGHPLMLSKKEFFTIYQKVDSVQTTLWECGSPFEWLDQEWMIKKYGKPNDEHGTFADFDGKISKLFINNSVFTTNNHLYLFDTAKAQNNTFTIVSQNIVINEDTTVSEFKKRFPDVDEEKTDVKNTVRFRFYLDGKSDDAFLFYFKNGKLEYVTLWWLLC